jgi:hypothetical protein
MKIVMDEDKWRLPRNRAPPRKHSEEKQKEIRKQVDALLELGAIKESQATEWSQVHLVPKPSPEGQPQKWRFTLDFLRLNSATGGRFTKCWQQSVGRVTKCWQGMSLVYARYT